jgi:Uncharacterized conserved protein containing a coiled-coil domain, COG5493
MLRLLKEDEEFRYAVAGLLGLEEILKRLDRNEQELVRLREDMVKGFERHDREIERLREDMMKGFDAMNRRISALGARWGLESEEAFREGLRGILEKELGLKVERWTAFDETGSVFGHPSQVEVDVAVSNGKVMLIEVSSHVKQADVAALVKKAELYERVTGRRPDRLIVVTPFAEERAMEAALKLGVEIYTRV